MIERLDDTIVAVASAPGAASLGVVRWSGPKAIPLADRLITPVRVANLPGARRVRAEVRVADELTLPCCVCVFREPKSYTREDLVEVHTVGSPAALELVRAQALAGGALPAEPGEFTARAFLRGRLDLSQAEAVAGVIRAEDDTQLRAARRLLEGALAKPLFAVRDRLAELLALIEAEIDFAEEPIEFISPEAVRERLAETRESVRELIGPEPPAMGGDELPQIMLVGPPNAGKSTLLNRLAGMERAITAEQAGTTRDVLSAPAPLGRGWAMVCDSAGLDEVSEGVISQGQAATVQAVPQADVVCVVWDMTQPDDGALEKKLSRLALGPVVVAANKCDLVWCEAWESIVGRLAGWSQGPVCVVSAAEGMGVDRLRSLLAEAAFGSPRHLSTVGREARWGTARQGAAIALAEQAIDRAQALVDQQDGADASGDLLAFELREAIDHLGAVTGEVSTDDLLSLVFADFCIGK
jgi:tRNA modification GTPase